MDMSPYPVSFSVTYPSRSLDRVTTFFRLIVAIPILVVLGTVSAGAWDWSSDNDTMTGGAGTIGVAVHAMIQTFPGRRDVRHAP